MSFASTVTLAGTLGAIAATVALVAIAVLSVLATKDMNRRGRAGLNYGVLIWLAWPIGVVLWVIQRGRYDEVSDVP